MHKFVASSPSQLTLDKRFCFMYNEIGGIMVRLLAILVLWSLPWQPQFLHRVAQLDVLLGCEGKPSMAGYCGGYYDDNAPHRAIRLCEHECLLGFDCLRHIVLHESQHHMQLEYRVWRWPGGYAAFEGAVRLELAKPAYTQDMREAAETLIAADRASGSIAYSELHAELPALFDLQIPPNLARWYPWFDLESRVATSQEDASRSIVQ